jgi:hypothetical protein
MFRARLNPSVVHRSAVACDQYRLGSALSTYFHSVLEKETKSRDTTITIVTKLWTGRPRNRDSIPLHCDRNVIEISNPPTDHTGDAYPTDKGLVRESDHSFHSVPRLRMRIAIFYPFSWRST